MNVGNTPLSGQPSSGDTKVLDFAIDGGARHAKRRCRFRPARRELMNCYARRLLNVCDRRLVTAGANRSPRPWEVMTPQSTEDMRTAFEGDMTSLSWQSGSDNDGRCRGNDA